MPGVVEDSHALPRRQRSRVRADRRGHLGARGIQPLRDLEPDLHEGVAHRPGVVRRILERGILVRAVADHQRELGRPQQLQRPLRLRPHPGVRRWKKQRSRRNSALQQPPTTGVHHLPLRFRSSYSDQSNGARWSIKTKFSPRTTQGPPPMIAGVSKGSIRTATPKPLGGVKQFVKERLVVH